MFDVRLLFRITLAATLLLGGLASTVQAASAGGAFTETFTWKNDMVSFPVIGSCSDPDGLYQLTLVTSGASHLVENPNGYKFVIAEHGSFTLQPIEASSPVTYSGQYSSHLSDTGLFSGGNFSFNVTFTSVGLGSDGTRELFHFTNIFVVTPDGIVNDRESGAQWLCN